MEYQYRLEGDTGMRWKVFEIKTLPRAAYEVGRSGRGLAAYEVGRSARSLAAYGVGRSTWSFAAYEVGRSTWSFAAYEVGRSTRSFAAYEVGRVRPGSCRLRQTPGLRTVKSHRYFC
jgi:hypothetical protein